ncbi:MULTISPECIES: M16 family metallopeptidase [Alteribacter]|uniref:Insulinase family protein n=1 Tax=Alteribacter keqinensis TaxID=2483800 RepID=A0A3M7TXB7_9BACI|nr:MULTISPECIES: pitrilysin family protein [Alteribacter]MBM7094225.1 insulinase family protein [Alteribacter salitolerans]RNA69542.1 insulinase family protein [Alteribacter keqinensis]
MIKRVTCDNGLRIVFEPNNTVRSVSIGVWIGTGSRFETKMQNGVSHFLEHMFFKGTKSRNAQQIAESFDSIGGQVNAFTSKEYTCYYAKVLDEHARHALEVLADMYFNSTFDQKEMVKEKGVVLEEIKMYEDTPDDIVHDLLSQAGFGDHPLGYPILGTEETLQTFSTDSLVSYMDQFYNADNVVISVCGNVDESFVEFIQDTFNGMRQFESDKSLQSPTFKHNKMARKKETEQAHLCLGYEGLPIGHKDIYSLILLNNVLGGSMSSRLFQEIRENRGLAYSVFSYHSSFHDTGMVTLYAGTAVKHLDNMYECLSSVVSGVKENGITERELKNAKEQLKGSLMLGLESTNSRMSRNGKNELLLGRHRTLDEIVAEIEKVSLSDVKTISHDVFSKDFAMTLVSPDGKLPSSLA